MSISKVHFVLALAIVAASCKAPTGNNDQSGNNGQTPSKAWVVSTLAGSGTRGFADGAGSSAQFNRPYGVAVDSSGNVYVADFLNNRIRKVTAEGEVSTLAGSGSSGFADGAGSSARFAYPYGVAADSSGNVYVADYSNNRIRKVVTAENGTVTVSTLAGSATAGHVDATGSSAQFNYPTGVAVDSSGNVVYVADYYNHRIRKIVTATGAVSTLAGSGTAGHVDATGTSAQFNFPAGVAVDSSGNVYVADYLNHRIRKITATGAVSTLAGSGTASFKDATGTSAQFSRPWGVAVDSSGNVYVADERNHRIRKVTAGGTVSTLAGTGTAGHVNGSGTSAQFYYPAGVAVDTSGKVYVADSANDRIRKMVYKVP